MSNPLRYDSLLVRHLARELDARLHGAPATAIRLDSGARRMALELADASLNICIHPTRGSILLSAPPPAERVIGLRRKSFVAAITAPRDERRLEIRLGGTGPGGSRPRGVVVELMTNQWNAFVLGDSDRILDVLWRRSAGGRALRVGAVYEPPPPVARAGVDAPIGWDEWEALLGPVPADERPRRLVERVAWTSPLNVTAILGDGELRAAYERYRGLVADVEARPVVLAMPHGLQPYPFPLPGTTATPCDSLLEAIGRAAGTTAPPAGAAAPIPVAPELLEKLRRRLRWMENRARRLAEQRDDSAPAAARLRNHADVLLANLHMVRRGDARVELQGFDGGSVEIELDPAMTPAENAERLYEAARKRERAARSLPTLIEAAEREAASLRVLLLRAESGDAAEDEVRIALEGVTGPSGESRSRAGTTSSRTGRTKHDTSPLPYRVYRTTGGHEVRVGRSNRANDDLTFRHSSPDDVWLHARDSAGAHVILRWPNRDANPPANDLREAAVLAALHSRARTSALVPVDWTRRKYVRKPRKSPPGRVLVERAKTIFVEPDSSLADRLRVQG